MNIGDYLTPEARNKLLILAIVLGLLMVIRLVPGGAPDNDVLATTKIGQPHGAMNVGDYLIWEAMNGLLLIPTVIGLVMLVRWFRRQPVFTERDSLAYRFDF
jgi:hypothetical protein